MTTAIIQTTLVSGEVFKNRVNTVARGVSQADSIVKHGYRQTFVDGVRIYPPHVVAQIVVMEVEEPGEEGSREDNPVTFEVVPPTEPEVPAKKRPSSVKPKRKTATKKRAAKE